MSVKQVNRSSGEDESCTEFDHFWHETNLASSSCYEVCDVQRDFILKVTKRVKKFCILKKAMALLHIRISNVSLH